MKRVLSLLAFVALVIAIAAVVVACQHRDPTYPGPGWPDGGLGPYEPGPLEGQKPDAAAPAPSSSADAAAPR